MDTSRAREGNKTWVIGGWRLYVVESTEARDLWHWNLRDIVVGWEINGHQATREAATIEALETAEAIESKSPKACRDYGLIVAGEPVIVSALPTTMVWDVLREALEKTGNNTDQLFRWGAYSATGLLCVHNFPIQLYFSHNQQPLNVSLHAGVGG